MATPGASSATSPDLRAVRALPFATVCVLVSALGHVCAGGGPVPVPTLIVGLVLVALPAAALAGRERGLPAIAGGLAVGELGLHTLFHLTVPAGSTGMAGMPGMAAGSTDPIARLAASLLCGPLPANTSAWQIVSDAGLDPHRYLAAAPMPTGSSLWAALGLTPAMLVGHLLAALVAGWWLRRGEAALFRLLGLALEPLRVLVRQLVGLLTAVLGADAEASRPRVPRRSDEPWRLPGRTHLRHQLVRRGPPRALPV
ncbi:hypothetical protein [Streptacidiphilus jiangxiensis]|uniref:Integral membrane protein n=1 Tax=Streptacidiphilus jiangxiensis TaxID=235985 RepID=A0A1H7J224_STRJI|nr:hypothetical protein [Streptacidiphilus jiangxiensis]SEK68779.1 hypothetical protein SAMN05414137_103118 [Streptacidiphilus jiangxiensis]